MMNSERTLSVRPHVIHTPYEHCYLMSFLTIKYSNRHATGAGLLAVKKRPGVQVSTRPGGCDRRQVFKNIVSERIRWRIGD
jgi:hypothetical protein